MTGQSTTATSHRLAIGKEVYSEDGAMLGHVGHVGRDAFLVRKGFWFLKDSVLPRSTVVQVQGKRVLLAINRNEARHLAATSYDFGEDESNFEEEQVSTAPPMRQTVNVIRNHAHASAPAPMPTPAFTDDATRAELRGGEYLTVPVIEEELQAHVRDVDAGRVRIVKTVVDEQATMQVPVRHEEVYVRQRAVYRPATADDLARGERVVDIPLHAQEVVTTKMAVVTGEVDVRKEVTEETEWVTDTVRREEVHVEEGRSGHVHRVVEGESAQGMRGMRHTEQPGSTLWEDESAFEDAPPIPRRTR